MTDDGALVWYAGYGSNLDPDRFRCYLHGGRPPGATRTYPGAREPADPLDSRPVSLPGRLVFGWESPTWGGGIAFFDPDDGGGDGGDGVDGGAVLARAYLVTSRQLADVLEQEMWRAPGADHDLAEVVETRRHVVGPGRYETLHLAGRIDDHPVVTFSADDLPALGTRAPSAAYVATMARGLRATHAMTDGEIVEYLLGCRGAAPDWDRSALLTAVAVSDSR